MSALAAAGDGVGPAVRIAVTMTSAGAVGIAATDAGIRAIELADSEQAVHERFAERFSAGGLVEDPEGLAPWLAMAVEAVENPERGAEIARGMPLDPQGTPFQRAVWDELARIEPGRTRSYAQVAAAIGRPTASRAVARACATNQLAVVVPCHRVVRSDGSLSGYRWGVERKREILARERLWDASTRGVDR